MKTLLTLLEKEFIEYRIVIKLPLFLALFAVVNFMLVMSGDNVSVSIQSTGNGVIDWGGNSDQFAGLIGKLNEIVAGILSLTLFLIYVPKTLRKEKQEGTLLFWRSAPVSDHLMIFAKLLFVLVIVPFIASLLLLFSDFIVWLMASFWLHGDMMASMGISLSGIMVHWVEFIGRLSIMSLALFPLACILLVISQLVRYPLLTVIMGVVLIKIALFQATGAGAAGSMFSDIYWLPVSILTGSSPMVVYLSFGLLSNVSLLTIGVLMYLFSCWLRGRDDASRMI
ncbi:ABC transporter [Photobacterium nomapromontoriensis]|uniref:ABC transporter n=1 Tax=Photobacterium nomapromontoriensis TaxID=2910237 RepID=UPI003D146524